MMESPIIESPIIESIYKYLSPEDFYTVADAVNDPVLRLMPEFKCYHGNSVCDTRNLEIYGLVALTSLITVKHGLIYYYYRCLHCYFPQPNLNHYYRRYSHSFAFIKFIIRWCQRQYGCYYKLLQWKKKAHSLAINPRLIQMHSWNYTEQRSLLEKMYIQGKTLKRISGEGSINSSHG